MPAGLPALTADYFEFLDIPRKLALDPAVLQTRFYKLSRQLHPDRFTQRPAEEQEYSLQATAILNDAYRVLRDPLQRAEYVLRQEGFDIGEQRSKDVPPEMLEEVFELNVALEELRTGDEDARPQLEQASGRFAAMRDEIDRELDALFVGYDAAPSREKLAEIRATLNRRRYIQNLVRDVQQALNPA